MQLTLFTTALLVFNAQCARILGVFPAPGYSQFILAENLMKEVAIRGHEVTVISPYIPQHAPSNYRTIRITAVLEDADDMELFSLDSKSLFENIMSAYRFGNFITDCTLKSKEVQELLRSNERFDLVIVEQFFNDALKGFATHFEAPLVLFSSMGITEWNKHYLGNPMLPSINAITSTAYTNHMSFFQRVWNVIGTIYNHFYQIVVVNPIQEEFLAKYFPKRMDFNTVINNASLMLLNSHVTTSENVLLPYNMIEIGGFHIKQNPLSPEVQKVLDDARNGAILFSMGSNLKSSDLSADTVNGIFRTFAKLKQTVLWKFETDLPDKPSNVYISKWLKQSDILAHPNVELFITHGGLLSITEAIYNGVPMVGIPVFGDQKMNMARARSNGIANIIPLSELSEETLSAAINQTLGDLRFRKNAQLMSALLRDRVVKPLDLALYWIEYVIRYRGLRFEAPAHHLFWYQVYMIDILVFALCSVTLFYLLGHRLIALVTGSQKKKRKRE